MAGVIPFGPRGISAAAIAPDLRILDALLVLPTVFLKIDDLTHNEPPYCVSWPDT